MNSYASAQIPAGSSNYLKFNKPEVTFRILDEPIMGTLGWANKKPTRKRIGETISVTEVDDPSEIKYFWAMPVYDYEDKQIKILEVTQKSILKAIQSYARDEDYGDPKGYDIKVTGTGEGLERRYLVTPKPPKKLDEGIIQLYKDMEIDLEALFTGDDPFKASEKKKEDNFIDEVSEAIS